MPLFGGNKDKGIQRLFINMPDAAKGEVVWKYPDSQIMQHSIVNVDLDYAAVFTNLGKVIGVLGPGRYPLGEGASLAFGWLVDRLTGNAYYDAELYYIATRDIVNVEFGGPVDNVSDKESGLVVSLRVFGELAFKVTDPSFLLAKLVGTDGVVDHNGQVVQWVKDQALAAIRTVLPDLVAEHGVLYMGALQDATGTAALTKATESLAPYGLAVTAFAQLNVNLPDEDAAQVKRLAQAKAFTGVAGSYTDYAKGQAMMDIAQGVEQGHVGAQPGMMVGMMMGTTPGTMAAPGAVAPAAAGAGGVALGTHFCTQCGAVLPAGAHFCPQCGTVAPTAASVVAAVPAAADVAPGPGYWKASDGNWYPPSESPGP